MTTSHDPNDTRPLILLDVDGVLNALDPKKEDVEGWGEPYRSFKSHLGYRITYNPALMKRLRAIKEEGKAEILWLTTWLDEANVLAPKLDLPENHSPVLPEERNHVRGYSPHAGDNWWKFPVARRVAGEGRPLVWLDDDLEFEREAKKWAVERPGPSLAIAPPTDRGLSVAHLDEIEAFVEKHAG